MARPGEFDDTASEDSMKHFRHLPTIIWVAAVLACSTGAVTRPAVAQNIIDRWSEVRAPPPPEVKKVTIDPKSTALLVMGFVRDSCNQQRRPRCVATIPHVKKLLTEARAHDVLIMHSVPCGSASGDFIVADLAPLPGEAIIPPNGPNKFLPFDVLCSNKDVGFDLEKVLKDHGIKTVITVGTQVQTAVLHTAAEAALRGYKVIVPIDGMSGNSLYPEQYTAWHLVNTERVMQQVTLTTVDLIGY
jgi:nicotinamidase-related amidase